MRTWRLARIAQRCGSCNDQIAIGEKLLELQLATSTTIRCQSCGERMTGEAAPDVIEEAPPAGASPASVPAGVRYQPSLGPEFVSASDIGLRRRGRR